MSRNNFEEDYRIYRNLIEHEDNLINHRLTWLLVSQPFLLAACISSGSIHKLIRITGVIISVTSYVSILAAIYAIYKLERKFKYKSK